MVACVLWKLMHGWACIDEGLSSWSQASSGPWSMHAHQCINITKHSNPCLITIVQWHPTFCAQIHPKFTWIIMRCVDFNSYHIVCIDFNKPWALHSHLMCKFQHLACVDSNKPWTGNSQNIACSLQLAACHCIILNITHRLLITNYHK